MRIALVLALCFLLLGCHQQPEGASFRKIIETKVTPGMSRDQVMDLLGVPQIMTPPGFAKQVDETWSYIVPGAVTTMYFTPKGRMVSWHYSGTGTAGLGLKATANESANDYSDYELKGLAEELRLLRMDNAISRAELPYPLADYLYVDITADTVFSPGTARTLSRQISDLRQRKQH